MKYRISINRATGCRGFTLLEILLATGIFAIVLIAINTVFFAGLQLRKRTTEAIEGALPLNRALTVLKTDLQNAVPPGGTMSGFFRAGAVGNVSFGQSSMSGQQAVSGTANLSLPGSGQGSILEFFTTTAQLREDEPWAEIQHVSYQLVEPSGGDTVLGSDLVRVVNRNLLTLTTPVPETERLVGNIEYMECEFFDGAQWLQTWDTTGEDSSLPDAVLVRVLPAIDPAFASVRREPIEIVVLVTAQTDSSTESTTEGSQ